MEMDLSQLPEVESYEDAIAKLEALQNEQVQLQQRLAQAAAETAYYQGAAKVLRPPSE